MQNILDSENFLPKEERQCGTGTHEILIDVENLPAEFGGKVYKRKKYMHTHF